MKRRFVSYLRDDREKAGANISWGSVFAGVVTFIAVFLTFSLIGSAIGFGLASPTSNDPLAGVGTGVMIWTVITFILSFMAAGFVSGIASQRLGLVHGFLSWATTIVVLVLLLSYTTATVLSGVGHVLGSVASVAGQGAAGVAGGVAEVAQFGYDKVAENLNIDTEELQENMKQILKDTDTPELHPDYLQNQLKEAGQEILTAGKNIAVHPDQADAILKDLQGDLSARAEKIGNSVDKDAISTALAKNSNMTPEEAQKATDNLYEGIQKASKEAEQKLNEASQALEEAKVQVEQTVREVREGAEQATNTTAKASGWAFVAMLLSAVLTSGFGILGNRVGSDPIVKRDL